jgi:SpoVK/Ycf46/Vps4 family AAA+-type ATPase
LFWYKLGTGKTTICKALAQQCQIRHNSEYKNGVLLEINSHTLFSKVNNDPSSRLMHSNKILVFDHIEHIAQQDSTFVYILIDEVESIAAARKVSHQNNEPGDAMRAVNAVLTSLDSLKRHSNVLVFCTSNMLEAIDPVSISKQFIILLISH